MSEKRYFLMYKDTLLGVLVPYDHDFPWIYCHFEAKPAFEPLRPLFERELKAKDEDRDEAYSAIFTLRLRLVDETGKRFLEEIYGEDESPLIHVRDDKAWFR